MTPSPDWIAVDWGTTNLRAWAMRGDEPLAEAGSSQGMGTLAPAGFEPALRALLAPWGAEGLPVVACGMVGARQGWVEAAYRRVPAPPLPERGGLTRAPGGLDVRIVPGLAQDDPPDVMRGEETKVAGVLALRPGWDGALMMPGTHPKWIAVAGGEVTGFRTFLTGELFAALAGQTVLRHSVGPGGWDEPAFLAAVAEALAEPQALAARLFRIRAETLLCGLAPAAARARLSGLLIGAELAAARPWWLGVRLALVGQGENAEAYAAALAAQGLRPERIDAETVTLGGLAAARRQL
jgi:2-dehydro-3-deoxygalactonokinase